MVDLTSVDAPSARRQAGVLLHLTSLPRTANGGPLGADGRRFVDFLAASGIGVWQVLPVGPTHSGSPYDLSSAHAGNPNLICLADLAIDSEVTGSRGAETVDGVCARLIAAPTPGYNQYCTDNRYWLHDYSLYQMFKARFGDRPWWEWPPEFRDREPATIEAEKAGTAFQWHCVAQYLFFRQWTALRQYARAQHVKCFGDMPFFVAHDSADVWAHRSLFRLDVSGMPEVVAGVPPDYFSETGQRWGNPLYDWDRMTDDRFCWWQERLRTQLDLFDIVRIDHFRGFDACWEIPASAPTAATGRWAPVPGDKLLRVLEKKFGQLPLVAEDLGTITPSVLALRDAHGLPGMRVLQFAFDGGADNPYLPHNYQRNCVVYTGTHDNDTAVGWFRTRSAAEQARIRDYLGDQEPMPWALIRAALASVADLAIVPLQDLLGLDSQARMNMPGQAGGSWSFTFSWAAVPDSLAGHLRHLLDLYGRLH
ncbi:MAG: 4-alpha-glucanotransferase [Acidiferrobacter sp.]